MKIVIIHWTDSALHGTQVVTSKDSLLKPMKGITCGLLIREDKDSISIATTYWGNDEWRNAETIYKKQIDFYQIKEIKTVNK